MMGNSGVIRRIALGLATSHTREFFKNMEYRNCVAADRDGITEFTMDRTKDLYQEGSSNEFEERYLACPLCQDQQVRYEDGWTRGNREHLHLQCQNGKLLKARDRLRLGVEHACKDLCMQIVQLIGTSKFQDQR